MTDPTVIVATFSGDVPDDMAKVKKTYISENDIRVEYI